MATISVVRPAVRQLLEASAAYRELPPDTRRQIAHDTTRVASYMADPHGLLSRTPRGGTCTSTTTARGLRTREPAAAHLALLHDPRVRDATTATAALLQTIDFPDFVADLLQGVFGAIVDSSIRQMEAYADLVRGVADSVDDFRNDAIDESQGRDWLACRYPLQFQRDARGRLRWRAGIDAAPCDMVAALHLAAPTKDLRDLVTAARRRIAIDRQQLLATVVMLGIQRIVVSDRSSAARTARGRGGNP